MVGDVSTLDGHNTTPNQFDTTWSVFDRLISYDAKLQPQPELAESWEVSADSSRSSSTCARACSSTPAASSPATTSSTTCCACATRSCQTPIAAQPEQLVHDDRHARQVHRHPEVGAAAAGVFDFFEYFNMVDKETVGGAGRQDRSRRHRALQVRRVGPGRSPDVRQEPELLAQRAAVLDRFVAQRPAGPGDAGAVRGRARSTSPKAPHRATSPASGADPKYQTCRQPDQRQLLSVRAATSAIPPLDNKQVRQALNYALDRKRFVDTFLYGTGEAAVVALADELAGLRGRRSRTSTRSTWTRRRRCSRQAGVGNFELDCNVLDTLAAAGQLRADLPGRPGQDRRQAERRAAGAGASGSTRPSTASTRGCTWRTRRSRSSSRARP